MTQQFDGFPEVTFSFLAGLSRNNDKAWFEAHRADYEAGYVAPAAAFVEALGPELRRIAPNVQFAPKINGSISRINRDVRFSKDKSPYKDHLDLWFWHGEKRGWACPGFYLRLTPEMLFIGVGMHGFPKDMLGRYREVVSHADAAEELAGIIDGVLRSGPYEVGGKTRKTVPRGVTTGGHASEELLLHEGLHAGLEWESGIARTPEFLSFCTGHFAKCWPIGDWVLRKLV